MGGRMENINDPKVTLLVKASKRKGNKVTQIDARKAASWMDEIRTYLEHADYLQKSLKLDELKDWPPILCGRRIPLQEIFYFASFTMPNTRGSLESYEGDPRRMLWEPCWRTKPGAKKMRQGYFWPTIKRDRQKKFLVVAVDHFSKWIEAEPIARITESAMIQFLWKHILCRFGIPRKITSDNGTQFQGRRFREMVRPMED
ncbi:UNVERIFIED_CONTAM: hypothetical protein Slati_2167800 [Sesamum latifolium]|uniref:Integrase catalytic domain-containing protein n=1 Tax=Sesamum latifolium TaxID=2727402 RepID=A0AAW2WUN9_9LAMI